ncbi:glycohydrolase toxin TNT-related protein [Microdochium nivale]|nr:glycohydrolase toxin TNT-related protein [Microdochium nivale]
MTVLVKPGDFPEVPHTLPVSALLQGYEELGISKEDFVKRFCVRIDENKDSWQYPNPEIGSFLADGAGKPVKVAITLGPGTLVDRFGNDDTPYFAPLGTPYAMRSLPPCVLGLPYSVWRVLKPLEVEAGPIAPGFLQPGLGTQYIAKDNATNLADAKMIEKLGSEEVLKLYQQKHN